MQVASGGAVSTPAKKAAPKPAPKKAAPAPAPYRAPTRTAQRSAPATTTHTAAKTATTAKAAPSYAASQAAQAANFGWSLAVINSNPELKALFAQATSTGPGGGWTTDHFVAKVRDTKWFKANSDTARQALILQKADPATYKTRVASAAGLVRTMADSMGAVMTTNQINQAGIDSVRLGWNSDQLKQAMAGYVKPLNGSMYTGDAATHQYQYQQLASQYGVTISPTTMGEWVRNSVQGKTNADGIKNALIAQASSRYPSLASRLQAGETVQQIAEPYMQSYAKILEVNPNTIPVTDNLVQSALSGTDAKGQPSTKTVWQFEQDLRNDPRYMKTQQAQDSAMGMAHQVLQDWGIKS